MKVAIIASNSLRQALAKLPELVVQVQNGDRMAEKVLRFGERYGSEVKLGGIDKDALWIQMGRWSLASDASHVDKVIGYLDNAYSFEREAAWDYLRTMEHFTAELIEKALSVAWQDKCRCVRDAANKYIHAAPSEMA
jgi:hypothetical protein